MTRHICQMCRDFHLCFLLVLLAAFTPVILSTKTKGCAAPPLLPNLPFFVVWNHPSSSCGYKGIDLNFKKWGIVDNTDDKFQGEKMTIFYSLGKWPHYSGTKAVYGGIPQLGNLTEHLAKAQRDAKFTLKSRNFSGLSVIDFEHWRPLYPLNFGTLRVYQRASNDLAKQRFPNMTSAQVKAEAIKEFNKAARLYVEETLKEVDAVRPYGKWGYYGYPRCWGSSCTGRTLNINDQMSWVFNHSSGLYPSIYFQLTVDPKTRADIIKKKLHETFRVKAKFSGQDAVILPYANNQNGPYKMFSKFDLSFAIGMSADMGASGVVLWGSSANMRPKNECLILQDYINTTLGPYVLNVTQFFSNCSQDLCAGHGRCVRKDYEAVYQQHLLQSGQTDCLIPEENLAWSKGARNFQQENKASKKGSRKTLSELFFKKSKYYELKYLDRNYEMEATIKERWEKISVRANEKKRRKLLKILDTWSEELYMKSLREENEDMLNLNENLRMVSDLKEEITLLSDQQLDQVTDESVIKFEIDEPDDNELIENENDENEDLMHKLTYDYDDYVCKCFPGWAGTHCKQHVHDANDLDL